MLPFGSPPRVQAASAVPAAFNGTLFDKYAASTPSPTNLRGHHTNASRLRVQGVKLICYLNTEVSSGRSTLVHLPEEHDTIEEVLPYIQNKMQLEKRMRFAKQLFTPTGTNITTWEQLTQAAAAEIPIIVGCGEKFDPTTVPATMVSFQEYGGGRYATQQTKHEIQVRAKRQAQQRAAAVRATGHGMQSSAAKSARAETIEKNRSQATEMRHEVMESLILRSSQHDELVRSSKLKNEQLRAERESRRAKAKVEAHTGTLESTDKSKRSKEVRLKKKQARLAGEDATAKVRPHASMQRELEILSTPLPNAAASLPLCLTPHKIKCYRFCLSDRVGCAAT